MHVRVCALVTTLLIAPALSPSALAQPPAAAAAMKTFASSTDVAALVAKAKAERKDQPLILQKLMELPPYVVNLEYRPGVAGASVHEKEAEIFFVVDGGGTFVVGGKLREERRQNPTNLAGSGIDGGESRTVAKGDFLMVPENTPHWFSAVNGPLVLVSMHVPRP